MPTNSLFDGDSAPAPTEPERVRERRIWVVLEVAVDAAEELPTAHHQARAFAERVRELDGVRGTLVLGVRGPS